jgi:ankyrin repeat protein
MLKKSLIGICALAGLAMAADTRDGRDTRLSDAAQQGNKEAVRTLLKEKVDVNAAQGDGMTALHWAANKDDFEMAKMLLAAGANPKAATRIGEITPLFLACASGDAPMIEAFLKAGADAKSVKANGTTALMLAASSGSADAVKVLLDHGAEINAKETAHGQTALMFAAALNRTPVVKLLASRGADVNLETAVRKLERVRFDQDGNIVEDKPAGARGAAAGAAGPAKAATPEEEQLDTFARSIGFQSAEYKIDTAAADKAQLDKFAKSIGLKEASYLVAKKVAKAGDIGFRGPRKVGPDFAGGMTSLIYAAREGHLDTVKALVEAGADVNHVSGGDKMSPIVEAVINGHLEIAKYLLDKGADVNLASNSGLTPLYATIDVQWAPKAWFPQPSTEQEKVTHLELMQALLDKGANVNAQVGEKLWFRSFTNDYTWVDPAGATAFWRAAQSGDVPAMKLLLAHGADAKLKNKADETPLHAATGIGWAWNWTVRAPLPAIDAVKLCVEQGNDVNALDNRGYTPMHGASFLGDNDMINYLVSKGAKADIKSKSGDSIADMANGPTRFGQPHAETVALLEKLGSPNSHNCRSDQCVIASKSDIYDRRTPEDYDQIARMDAFAKSVGMSAAVYLVDSPNFRGAARPGGN